MTVRGGGLGGRERTGDHSEFVKWRGHWAMLTRHLLAPHWIMYAADAWLAQR